MLRRGRLRVKKMRNLSLFYIFLNLKDVKGGVLGVDFSLCGTVGSPCRFPTIKGGVLGLTRHTVASIAHLVLTMCYPTIKGGVLGNRRFPRKLTREGEG